KQKPSVVLLSWTGARWADKYRRSEDVLHHLVKLRTAFNRFTGFSRILIFVSNLIIIEFCKGFHAGFLGIQRVTVNLHGGGHSRICINFYLFFFHKTSLCCSIRLCNNHSFVQFLAEPV